MQIGTVIHTLISRLLLLVLICLVAIPVGIMMIVPPKVRFGSRFLYRILYWFNSAVVKGTLVPVTYKGTEHIPSDQPVIFASNHQSSLDIPLVGVLGRGKPQLWLARSELLNTWLLRVIVSRLAVVVDVNSKEKAMRSLRLLMRFVRGKDIDIMIFPEGQRYTDDAVHEFFGGFVTLAKLLKRPVVPVRIFGANRVYPPHSFLVKYHPITVRVGKPLMIQEGESDEQFKKRVHDWFLNAEA